MENVLRAVSSYVYADGIQGGLAYPLTFNYLMSEYGFPKGTRVFAAILLGTSLLVVAFGSSNPDAERRPLCSVFKVSTWITWTALGNLRFMIYTLGICFMFFAFYPLLFHITEWAEHDEREKIHVVWYLAITNGYVFGIAEESKA